MSAFVVWWLFGLVDFGINYAIYLRNGPSEAMKSISDSHTFTVFLGLAIALLLGPIALGITASRLIRHT